MSDHLTPVQVCERLIGPLPVLERIAGYRPKAGYGWLRSAAGRAPGDFPSTALQKRMLAYSNQHDLGLTADHLVFGAEASEIEAILAARGTARIEAAE